MGKIIFVIDDDEDDRQLFQEALLEIDKTIQYGSAKNGHEALAVFNNKNFIIPDFIFLDLNMPKLSGKDCLVLLRKIPALAGTRIIIFTTSKLNEEAEEIKKLGADHCITKPLLFADLKDIIAAVLSGKWTLKQTQK